MRVTFAAAGREWSTKRADRHLLVRGMLSLATAFSLLALEAAGASGCPGGKYLSNGMPPYTAGGAPAPMPSRIPAASCRVCPPGKYAPGGEAVSAAQCKACPAGRFQLLYGRRDCFACAVGKFQPEAGTRTCRKCPAGKHVCGALEKGGRVCGGRHSPGLGKCNNPRVERV